MDDGYYDMYKVMEALVEINFDGLVIPDHVLNRLVPRQRAQPASDTAPAASRPSSRSAKHSRRRAA